jgi:gamma-glutamylcyclotransferase (GGCT)/AIG2-like uncharacterized protein YtfP
MSDFAPTALFAYGALALPDVVDALTGRVPQARPARLAGYRCRLLLGETYPGVERYPGSATDGVLYSGLTPADLSILDTFEDEPYQRRVVTVKPVDGDPIRAWAYVVPAHVGNLLSSEPWEPEHFSKRAHQDTLRTCRRLRASRPPALRV